ncbi:PAS domain S-box protein [Thauera sp.]|jgi:PAS domain S-box-containing protein|uniref:PAS domain S-box protein n=1 Tax=Thauera sp. TaxID=1905334 RepID=UPI002A36AB56|nr:PAS domain S-box protein [Thauera sp.]MDX9885756.1 PAS domain S-box protein [Thauera sp.]
MSADALSAESEFDFVVDNAPCAIIEWDPALHVRRWSAGAERLFGWSAAEVVGRRIDAWTLIHADDLPGLQQALVGLLDDSAPRDRLQCLSGRRDGSLAHTEWHNAVRRDGEGRALSLLSYVSELKPEQPAERTPRSSEAHYRTIFANSHAVMLILDPGSGRIVDANHAAEKFYGWTWDTLTRMHISEVNTLSAAALQAELEAAHQAQRTHFEFRHRRADGSIRDVEVHSGPVADGDHTLLFSIVHDITDRKQAEALSRRWERFFQLSNLGIAIHDASDNTIIDVNHTYASQHGYGIEEMRHMPVQEVYAAAERDELPARLAQADRLGNISFETIHLRKDGSLVPMVIGVTALQDDNGQTVARFVFALDIGARKAAEEELRKLSRAVEESPESIVITNTRAEIEYVNQAFVNKTGYSRAEALGQNPRVLQSGHTSPETYRSLWSTVTSGRSWSGEFFNRRKDGTEYIEHVTITPIHDESGAATHYVAVKQDITEERRMEEELLRYREHLEGLVASRTTELQRAVDAANVANRAKSEFLTTMSHEIRTPMNGVIGLLDVLEHSASSVEQTHLIEIMRESATTLLRLIDDILDFSKIEEGNLELDIGPVPVHAFIAGITDIMQPVAERKAVKLSIRIEDDVPAVVSADALRLQQILLNLVSNAVKFSSGLERPGRVEIRASIAGEGLIRFMVTDNGIGMAPEVLGKIFQPFSQAESSTTRRFGGTGLGLSISSRLVQMLKGKIEVRSLPGRGTRFVVTLPLSAINAPAAKYGARPPMARSPAAPVDSATCPSRLPPRGPILVAEDNEINRRVIERQLALLGLQCDMAENGREALARWRNGQYALLLTDLHMPEMDGYELTARIRGEEAHGERLPIIAVTANALRGEDQRCIDAGMDAYITKPVQVEILRQVLARWMPASDVGLPVSPAPASAPASLPVFDPLVLPGLIGEDDALIGEFLAEYRVSAVGTVQSIRQACADGDWHQAGELAHRLKSSSRSVGAMCLGEICAEIELAGRNGDSDLILCLVKGLETALDALMNAMPPDQTKPGTR